MSVGFVDVGSLPPSQRHEVILMVFDEIQLGDHIRVVSNHESVNLLPILTLCEEGFRG